MQLEKDAIVRLLAKDGTAVLVDGRDTQTASPRLRGAVWIPLSETSKAKDDGRLPMTDHNTRIFVVADTPEKARAVADSIVRDAFHNVAYFAGPASELSELIIR